jgi:hypothetical protein
VFLVVGLAELNIRDLEGIHCRGYVVSCRYFNSIGAVLLADRVQDVLGS